MGKVGKPQKTKRHKKMKTTFDSDDPLKNFKTKKATHNMRPSNDEDQEFPKKVREIMNYQKNMKKKKKPKQKVEETFKMVRGMSVPMRPAPVFKQGKNEAERDFMRRVDIETQRVLTKARIEQEYKVNIDEDDETNTTKIKKKKSEKKKQKEVERKKKKKESKAMKKIDRKGDFADYTDKVEFGETVLQPPSLTTLPRKARVEETTAKPGKRALLLKQVIEDGTLSVKKSTKVAALANRQTGQTVKRKFLSPAQQQITDFQRQKAIDLYRQMKEKKLKQT